jgi:hypothetical protein
MRRGYLCLLGILIATISFAQNLKPIAQKINERKIQKVAFKRADLFKITAASVQRNEQLKGTVSNSTVMEFNKADVQTILQARPDNLTLVVPSGTGNIELELFKTNLVTPDFSVVTNSSGDKPVQYNPGMHYWGIIKGDNSSIAAISIFDHEVMGMISSPSRGNLILGKLENDLQERHILYNQNELKTQPAIECLTKDDHGNYSSSELGSRASASSNCIRLYWEANYDLYVNKGSSVTNVTNYLTGLFNQSAIIYSNDSIPVSLSEIYVWTSTSPYTATTTSSLLSQFQSYRNSFNGDLGNLIGLAGGGGIAAGFSGLCSSNLDNSQCYSGISSGYNNVPTYSWSVEVVTHEQGHLMGSRHTHACVWNGNNTAIDNCGPTAGYAYEGSCSGAPTPVNGGTIMSYCHLVSGVGINFSNGFGTQPKNVIRNKYNNALCLTACSGTSCNAPSGMNTASITTSSATFNWTAISGATSYVIRYRVVGTSTWSTGASATNSLNVSALASGANYEWQVQTVCSAGSSSYTSSTTFTTAIPPCNAPTGMNTSAVTTSSATFNWTAVSGALSYNIQYRIVGTVTWSTGTSATNSFNASGLAAGTNYEWQVQTVCSGGSSGFTSSTTFATSVPPCSVPTGMNTISITTSSATFSWTAVSGAISYNVHYRVVGTSSWNNVSSSISSYNASGLSAGTNYEWQVQTVCSGGSSTFSSSVTFVTISSGCADVYEPNNSKNAAVSIVVGTDIYGLINPVNDLDFFKFNNTSGQPYIKVTLTNLPADYDVSLYQNNSGNAAAVSQIRGNGSETIIYHTNTVGTWKVRVNGYNGAFNSSLCYTLRVELSNSAFSSVEGREGLMTPDEIPHLLLYPNPAKDKLNVEFNSDNNSIAKIVVYNIIGNKVMSSENSIEEGDNVIDLNTSKLTNGIYIFEIENNGEVIRRKFSIAK